MPTIFIIFGFVFKFYSDDNEPIHVHVTKDGHKAKYIVDPEVIQVFNHGFKKHEISMIEGIIQENVEVIKDRRNDSESLALIQLFRKTEQIRFLTNTSRFDGIKLA